VPPSQSRYSQAPASHHRDDCMGWLIVPSAKIAKPLLNSGVVRSRGAPLRVGGINLHQHNLDLQILDLAKHGIGRSGGKPQVAQHGSGDGSALHRARSTGSWVSFSVRIATETADTNSIPHFRD